MIPRVISYFYVDYSTIVTTGERTRNHKNDQISFSVNETKR